jgi:uncharacterized protein (TIGR03435 family)
VTPRYSASTRTTSHWSDSNPPRLGCVRPFQGGPTHHYPWSKRIGVLAVALVALSRIAVVVGQDATVEWEAVSIKPVSAPPPLGPAGRAHDVFNAPFITAHQLLAYAYGLPQYRVIATAPWVTSEHFQVLAKASSTTTRDRMRVLVQQLLAERFRFTGHRESRELPTYDLVMARSDRRPGPNLRPAAVDCTPFLSGERPASEGPTIERAGRITPRCATALTWGNGFLSPSLMGRTLQQFAAYLSGQTSRDVFDRTRLSGVFDFDVTFADDRMGRGLNQLPLRDAPALLTALPEQLGLKLMSSKRPVDVLVIDHIERPTQN